MKGATPEQTISAIKSVYEGIGWIDPAIARLVFSNLQRPEKQIISTPEIKNQLIHTDLQNVSLMYWN